MQQRTSFVSNLKQTLEDIEASMMELLGVSRIHHFVDDPYSPIVVIGPEYYWETPSADEQRMQMTLRQKYTAWFEKFELLFEHAALETRRQINETNTFVMQWINKDQSWNIKPTIDQCKAEFHNRLQTFYDLLSLVGGEPERETILVPDTNALIFAPDVAQYAQAAGNDVYTVVIVPTVLSELDKLKVMARDATFREKVNGVIRRLKGLRTQGNLQTGVTVNKTVTVRMIAHEPTFKRTLSWLDRSNNDDRIIASVIEIQQANPTAHVIVVTGDMNLQNKAEMAGIPFAEVPGPMK